MEFLFQWFGWMSSPLFGLLTEAVWMQERGKSCYSANFQFFGLLFGAALPHKDGRGGG